MAAFAVLPPTSGERTMEIQHSRHFRPYVRLSSAKQRNGPTGDVPLTFLKEYTRFENRAREQSG
jgi:replicative DNA helicase